MNTKINVFGLEEEDSICEFPNCYHPMSWHDGARIGFEKKKGRRRVLCHCTHFCYIVEKKNEEEIVAITNTGYTLERKESCLKEYSQKTLEEWK